jgi:mRNA m6A methyltransferase catalytic subunit
MELPYGTMADDEMRTLNVPTLQTDGLIFLWVTVTTNNMFSPTRSQWLFKGFDSMLHKNIY